MVHYFTILLLGYSLNFIFRCFQNISVCKQFCSGIVSRPITFIDTQLTQDSSFKNFCHMADEVYWRKSYYNFLFSSHQYTQLNTVTNPTQWKNFHVLSNYYLNFRKFLLLFNQEIRLLHRVRVTSICVSLGMILTINDI